MYVVKNYIESNWIFDTSLITCSISSFCMHEDRALFGFLFIVFFLTFLFKIIYNWKKIQELITVISQTSVENPEPVDKTDFYDLNISIKENFNTLDIFKGRQLEHSFKKDELEKLPDTAFLVALKTEWKNWNWCWKSEYYDNYFQLVLHTGNETCEIVRIRENVFQQIEYPINRESFIEFAHSLGNKMKIKIKDSAQQWL